MKTKLEITLDTVDLREMAELGATRELADGYSRRSVNVRLTDEAHYRLRKLFDLEANSPAPKTENPVVTPVAETMAGKSFCTKYRAMRCTAEGLLLSHIGAEWAFCEVCDGRLAIVNPDLPRCDCPMCKEAAKETSSDR